MPASTAYVISWFASFVTIENDFQTYELCWYCYADWKHPASVFELLRFWALHQTYWNLSCKNEIPKLKLLSRLQWSLYALMAKGCRASHIYWHDRREFEEGDGREVLVSGVHWICSRNCCLGYVIYDIHVLFNSSLCQTMTPWLKKPLFVKKSLVPPPGSTINEGWQTS